MGTEFRPGDEEFKRLYGNILEMYKELSLLDTMFYKYNLEAFNKFSENIFQSMMKYYDNYSKAIEKFADTNNSSSRTKQDNIDISSASMHDIFNYLSRYSMVNPQFQVIMKLDGRLDFDKLKKAVRLSVDEEPVLGSRFVEADPPYWKRLDNLDDFSFCSLEETDNSDEAVLSFLQSPLEMDNAPKVKVKIIRSEQCDILGVKVNNACFDGTGTKKYIHLLSHIYSCIDQEAGTYVPKPQMGNRKDQDMLFKELSITCPESRWNSMQSTTKNMWEFPWKQRGGSSVSFELCRFPQGSLESIYQYGKPREATVNDLILTAFYRAMFKISKPIHDVPMNISSTIDLRRYLPDYKTRAIRNLSGMFITRIARTMNESFEGTLSKVVNATKEIKESRTAENNSTVKENTDNISFTYFHDYFERMAQTTEISAKCSTYIGNVCFPELSNLGNISKSLISFGKNIITDAYIIPPAMRAPGLLLLANSYNGVLTMSIGYCKTSISQRDMKNLLNIIKGELMRGCGCEK